MYFVILIVLVCVLASGTSQIYNNEPRHEIYERPFVNPPTDTINRNSHGDINYNNQNGHIQLNHHEFHGEINERRWTSNPNEYHPNENLNNNGQFHETNNRELSSRDRNDRSRNENPNQGLPYGQSYEPNSREFIPGDRNSRDRNENLNQGPTHGQFQELNNKELIPRDRDARTRNENPNQGFLNGQSNNRESIPSDINERNRKENPNQGPNHGRFQELNNREFIPSDINDRNRYENPNQGPPHGLIYETNNRQYISSERNGNENSNQGPHGPHNREFVPGDNDRDWNAHANSGHIRENTNNQEQFNMRNNGDLSANDYNNRNHNTQGRSHDNTGSMDINMAFDRRENHNIREQSNLNKPRQSFNINNEYSNRDIIDNSTSRNNNRNDRYNQHIQNTHRRQDGMTLEDYNRGNDNQRNMPANESNVNIVTLLNKLNNNTNQNPNRDHRNSGFRQTDQGTKAVIENEVPVNPLENINKENGTLDNDDWVWGVDETTTLTPVTLDDRAAFTGDQCPTGYARFRGMCVQKD